MVISRTGIAHNISKLNSEPTTALIIRKTKIVGKNLKIAMTTAEIGSITLGKAVFKINLCPAVIDLTPPVREFEIK